MTGFHGFLGLQSRGLIALPSELRRPDAPGPAGAQVEVTEREDGVTPWPASLRVKPVRHAAQ